MLKKFITNSIQKKLVFVFTAVILVMSVLSSIVSLYVFSENLTENAHKDLMEIAKEEAK